MRSFRGALLALILLSPAVSFAQGVTPAPSVRVQDEGGTVAIATTLNCTGSGITCSVTGGVAALNASGGSGSANVVEVSLNFGTGLVPVASVTVTGQAWVSASSVIVCSPFGTTADGQTVENIAAAHLTVSAASRVASTGFDLWIMNPHSLAGTVRVHCTGA